MSTGLGSSKKGSRIADSSMVTQFRRVYAQGVSDSTYSTDLKKNSYRPMFAIANSFAFQSANATFQSLTGSTSTPSASVPDAPVLDSITAGDTELIVDFTAPTNDGGSAITDYEYSTDSGSTFVSASTTTSPFTITGLTNGTSYTVVIRAINSVGPSVNSNSISGTPVTAPNAPTLVYTLADDGGAYIYFTAGTGTPTNYEYSVDSASFVALSPSIITSPVRVPSLTNGVSYSIRLRAVNGAGSSSASNSLSVTPVDPTTASPNLYYDPSNSSSYTGSGTTVSNIGSYGTKNGTLTGSVSYNAGVKGGVFDFPGTNGSIITFTSFDFGNSISVAAWVYPRSKSDINGLLTNAGANVPTNGFKFQWNFWQTNSRAISFQAGNGSAGGDDHTPLNLISYNTWQHFGYVFDKTNRRIILFYNGIPAAMATDTETVANINTNASFNIGGYVGGFYTMNAQLGYIKVYNTLLDATQMYADYNTTRSRFL